jgi:acyl carrier protein
VAAGYWRRESGSAEPFATGEEAESDERRYRTGDLMSWTADGRLLFLGRKDEQVKLRGFRIEPGEIEAALADDPAIGHAAVVLRSTAADASSQRLVAFVEIGAAGSTDGWRDRLAQRLPQHMIPSRLVVLEALPRLPNGKIDRRRLQEIELEPEAPADRRTALATNTEQSLRSLWEGLLGQTGIDLDDNFFELGGHSLLVIEMAVAIERDFQVRLSAAEIFENPTVRLLARTVEQRGDPGSEPFRHMYPIQPTGQRRPLVFAIPHFFTEAFAERFRGERPVYGLRGVGLRAEGNLGRWRTMHDLGEELVDEIGRRFGDGRVAMAGYSFGATMAFEAVREMEARGVPAAALYLIAPMPLDFVHLGPLRLQLHALRQPVDELSLAEALGRYLRTTHPFSLRLYRKIWRWWAIEPWRRLLCQLGRARRAAGRKLTQRILWADVRVDRFRLHAAYRPGPIRTPSVIFNPTEPATDAAATWRPFFDGPLTVVDIPDPHLGETQTAEARKIILGHLDELEPGTDMAGTG